jgi:hypothetical protein
MSKRITLKGLADYMTASHVRQRSILKQFKYPKDEEGSAKILYYKDARDRIAAFHKGKKQPAWLLTQADSLDALANGSAGRVRARLRHNARALRAYEAGFSKRIFEVQSRTSIPLNYGDVTVSVVPDLTVIEGKTPKLVRLEFSKDDLDPLAIKILSQGLFEAATQKGLGLKSASILLFDVERGTEHRGARLGAQMRKEIEAACQTISAVWDTI